MDCNCPFVQDKESNDFVFYNDGMFWCLFSITSLQGSLLYIDEFAGQKIFREIVP